MKHLIMMLSTVVLAGAFAFAADAAKAAPTAKADAKAAVAKTEVKAVAKAVTTKTEVKEVAKVCPVCEKKGMKECTHVKAEAAKVCPGCAKKGMKECAHVKAPAKTDAKETKKDATKK
ncbi:MAG: hypothetical protein AABZ39_19870 [Spirochaetota bacterium]